MHRPGAASYAGCEHPPPRERAARTNTTSGVLPCEARGSREQPARALPARTRACWNAEIEIAGVRRSYLGPSRNAPSGGSGREAGVRSQGSCPRSLGALRVARFANLRTPQSFFLPCVPCIPWTVHETHERHDTKRGLTQRRKRCGPARVGFLCAFARNFRGVALLAAMPRMTRIRTVAEVPSDLSVLNLLVQRTQRKMVS